MSTISKIVSCDEVCVRFPKASLRDVGTGSEGAKFRHESGDGKIGYIDAHLNFVVGRRRKAVAASAFDVLPIPVVVVDSNLNVICLNRAAGRLFARSQAVEVCDGQLVCADSQTGSALAEMVSTCLPSHEVVDARPQTVEMRTGGEGENLWVRATPLAGALNRSGYVVLSLTADRAEERGSPAPLERFGLTAAEARVAAAITGGLSVRDTSRLLNISPNTVRKYLQIIFQKVGVRRQVDLVRVILAPPTD